MAADKESAVVEVLDVDPTILSTKGKEAIDDKALNLLSHVHLTIDLDGPEAKAVLRKIDLNILPLLVIMQFLQNLDKATMSYGAVMGLKTDLNLTSSEYSWLGSIIYFGFLAFEIPTHFLLQRVNIARYISVFVICWGITVACSAAATNFAGMAVLRFILGVFESTTAPVLVLITGSWYTPAEQISRIALWYCTTGVSQIVGGILAYGLFQAGSFNWQGMFVLCGGLTVVHGCVLLWRLVASPTAAKFLDEEEKVIALERLRSARTGTESWGFSKHQALEAVCDVRFYLLFILLFCTGLPNGGVNAFGPTIISGFGFDTGETLLLSMAPGLSLLVAIGSAAIVGRTMLGRAWSAALYLIIGMIGVILMLKLDSTNKIGRYVGYCLFYWYAVAPMFILAFMASSVSGTTKKLAFNLSYNLGYCAGNIVGPQTYRGSDAPNYYPAKYTMLAVLPIAALMMIGFWAEHYRLNKKNARLQARGTVTETLNSEFSDLSDKQQHLFRYPY